MKPYTIIFSFLLLFGISFSAQSQTQNVFTGAKATLKHYKALYVLNNSDEKKINGTLRNIKNALEDPRLKGKLEVELVVFGDGVAAFDKNSPYQEKLKDLKARGVLLAECENTLKERNIDKSTLYDFVNFVPSGNGEIIIRQQQGWAVVHP
ncbi:MAG: DsrE family protein [Candidatus Pedobacter colombiensis]|uniref:DsrE family protein n=1 Tax=Candidatus Pedobacter colombiensis TaxID=3121371 RepID=A0AAJ6B7Z9_9SPHI|nr:DsrE family protein [Pedobacter sp.]WEK18588.1 MAG: DsrE family protein [Pedobacter sp.]